MSIVGVEPLLIMIFVVILDMLNNIAHVLLFFGVEKVLSYYLGNDNENRQKGN